MKFTEAIRVAPLLSRWVLSVLSLLRRRCRPGQSRCCRIVARRFQTRPRAVVSTNQSPIDPHPGCLTCSRSHRVPKRHRGWLFVGSQLSVKLSAKGFWSISTARPKNASTEGSLWLRSNGGEVEELLWASVSWNRRQRRRQGKTQGRRPLCPRF